MRILPILLCSLGLFAAEPLRIVAVERQGLPPYEDDQRIYRLQGASRVSQGEILQLSRPGGWAQPGRLRVLLSRPDGVLATLERRGSTYPLKGDVALHSELGGLPEVPSPKELSPVPSVQGTALTVPREPRALKEALFFLPGDATLSPLGRAKVDAWAREYGKGQWTLEIPAGKGQATRLDGSRAKALKAALEAAGAKPVQIKGLGPQPGQRANAVFIRYQESAPPRLPRPRKHGTPGPAKP